MRRETKASYPREEIGYIDGNTVRKAEAVPKQRSEEVHRELQRKQELDKEREERQRNARLNARKNQEKAMQMSPGYVAFLMTAVLAMVGVCTIYLHMRSEISNRMRNIASLESQVLDLTMDNDAMLKKINTSVNMEAIRQTAITQLGMVYPTEGQIIYFHVDPDDYMNQYEDIPKK